MIKSFVPRIIFLTLLSFACVTHAWADKQVPVMGNFSSLTGSWQLNLMEGASAEAQSEPIGQGKFAVHVTVPAAGDKRYHVQLVCKGVALHADKIYRLHFRLRSKPASELSVIAGIYHGKFSELWRQDHIACKEDWTECDCDIKPNDTDEEAQIIFSGLAGQAGDYWFSDVSLLDGK